LGAFGVIVKVESSEDSGVDAAKKTEKLRKVAFLKSLGS
jgi:hypothetical protein